MVLCLSTSHFLNGSLSDKFPVLSEINAYVRKNSLKSSFRYSV